MNTLLVSHRVKGALFSRINFFGNKLFALPLLLFVLLLSPQTQDTTMSVLADAYFQVAVFVYASLALFYIVTFRISADTISAFIRQHPRQEVAIAAFLGALPGCGGAIIVVTQYTRGTTSFGAVVAVLTSTMGDAAFLLLAQSPIDSLVVMANGVLTGTLSGIVINKLHNYKETRSSLIKESKPKCDFPATSRALTQVKKAGNLFWLTVSIPSLTIALMTAFQLSVSEIIGISEQKLTYIGATMCLVSIALGVFCGSVKSYASVTREKPLSSPPQWQTKAALDTQFVLTWVVVALLLFEIPVLLFNIDVGGYVETMGSSAVLMGILIGLLPGCGPQIFVTNLYLIGAIPFSAQLGNAISNDGDALFPAIALSPKAAILATVYSSVPAFLIGYGYFFVFEYGI